MPKCNFCQNEISVFLDYDYPVYVRPVEKKDLSKVSILPIKIGFCRNCNHVMQINPPQRALEKVYKKFYKTFQSTALSGIGSKEADDFAVFVNKNISGKNLLEIGCSDGYFLNLMQKKGWNVWGCDPSPKTQIAIERFKIPVKKKLFYKDLFDKKFDCIVIRHVLEHIEDVDRFLNEISSSLEPNGYLAIEVPNIIHTLKFGVIGSFIHEHISYFTPQSLENLLNKMDYITVFLIKRRNVIYWAGRHSGKKLSIKPVKEKDKNLTKNLIHKYIKGLERLKRELMIKQKKWLAHGYSIYLYGGGGHTLGLLNLLPLQIKAIIDKDESKKGKFLVGFKNLEIYSDDFLKTLSEKDVVIISSEFFQDEIAKDLQRYADKGVKVLKLYPHGNYLKKQL